MSKLGGGSFSLTARVHCKDVQPEPCSFIDYLINIANIQLSYYATSLFIFGDNS